MRALLAQLKPHDGALEPNLSRLEAALAEHPDVQLAIFPELFLSGYELDRVGELAISAQGPEMDRLRRAAARWGTAVICGFSERTSEGGGANTVSEGGVPDGGAGNVDSGGGVANAAACVDTDGSLVGIYRKANLFGRRERAAFVQGEELLLVGLAGRTIAPMICFDVEFPEPARALAGAGADLLVTIAANMRPYGEEHALHARARALENRCAHLYVNRVGATDGLEFVGGSVAIDSSGRVTVSASGAGADAGGPDAEEQLLEVEVPPRWEGGGSDGDYLAQVRQGLPVRVQETNLQQASHRTTVAGKVA